MALNQVCLDTNGYTAFMRGDARITHLLEEADIVVIPAVVLGELHAAFVLGGRREKNLRELSRFLDQPGCRIAEIGADLAERYGELVRVLRRQGTPTIPTNDLWVAAVALHTAATVVTLDHHSAQIPLLPVAP